MAVNEQSLKARLAVQRLQELPPMSPVVARFLHAVDDNQLEVRQLAAIIEQDPGLAARLVGVANSPYFGYPERVATAEEAIFKVLGLNTARNLALGIVLSGPFSAERCPAFDAERYWASSLITASLSQAFAAESGKGGGPSPGEAYLCGLLHSIGLLVLVHLFPEAMNKVLQAFVDEPASAEAMVAAERQVLETDHLEAGGWLARKWHLPATVLAAVEHHLDTDPAGPQQVIVRLIHAAQTATPQLLNESAQESVQYDCLRPLGIPDRRVEEIIAATAERRKDIVAMSRTLAG